MPLVPSEHQSQKAKFILGRKYEGYYFSKGWLGLENSYKTNLDKGLRKTAEGQATRNKGVQ